MTHTQSSPGSGYSMREALNAACLRLQSFLDTFGDVGDCETQADLNDWIDASDAPAQTTFTPGDPVEIRKVDGEIDEIVIRCGDVHIEQMDASSWFIGVNASDGGYHQFWFGAKNRKSHVHFRHTESSPPASQVSSTDAPAQAWPDLREECANLQYMKGTLEERVAELQYEAGMYKSLYENAAETIAKMAETFSDQGRDGHQIAKAVRASVASSTDGKAKP